MLAYAPEMATYVPNPDRDPLGAVPHLSRLTAYNGAQDVRAILGGLEEMAGHGPAHQLDGIRIPGVALQTTADLDMLASSAARWGVDPIRHVPGLGRLMFDLGEVAKEVGGAPDMAARITLDTYVHPRELPDGQPVMFTGSKGERLFIPSLHISYYSLRRAVAALSSADLVNDSTDDLVDRLDMANWAVTNMFDMNLQVSTLFREDEASGPFGAKFQPFFPELHIEGRPYKPSSGIQSGFSELELLLRAIDGDAGPSGDARMFAEFHNGNVSYLPAHRRAEIIRFVDTNTPEGSDIPMSYYRYIRGLEPGERRRRLAEAYLGVITAETQFAKSHFGTTYQDAKKSRPADFRGGGGKTLEQLRDLKKERQEHRKLAQTALLVAA